MVFLCHGVVAQGMDAQHVELEGRDRRPRREPTPLVELVDDVPAADKGTDLGQEKGEIALEIAAVITLAEAPQLVEPAGMSEVMEGDEDPDALLRQAPQPRRLPDVQPTDRPGTKLATLLLLWITLAISGMVIDVPWLRLVLLLVGIGVTWHVSSMKTMK